MSLYLVLQFSFLRTLLIPIISYTFIQIHNYILVKNLFSLFSGLVSLTWNGAFTGFLSISISTIPVLSSPLQPVYSSSSGFYSTPNSYFPFILYLLSLCIYSLLFILYYTSLFIRKLSMCRIIYCGKLLVMLKSL